MEHTQLMQGSCGRHIQKLGVAVVHRIFFSGGIQDQYGVEFQTFGVLHRKYQDAAAKHCLFQIIFQYGNIFAKLPCRQSGAFPAAADYGDGV